MIVHSYHTPPNNFKKFLMYTHAWAYETLGLKMNIGETKVISTTRAANETNIKFDAEPLAVVQRFTYLGSIVNERENLNCEIHSRTNVASKAFWKLRHRVFDNHHLLWLFIERLSSQLCCMVATARSRTAVM